MIINMRNRRNSFDHVESIIIWCASIRLRELFTAVSLLGRFILVWEAGWPRVRRVERVKMKTYLWIVHRIYFDMSRETYELPRSAGGALSDFLGIL